MEYARLTLLLLVQLASHAWCALPAENTGDLTAASGNGSPSQEMVTWLEVYFGPTAESSEWGEHYETGKYGVVTFLNVPSWVDEQICDRLKGDGFAVESTPHCAFGCRRTISGYHRESVGTTHNEIMHRQGDRNHKNIKEERINGYVRTVSKYPKELLESEPTKR